MKHFFQIIVVMYYSILGVSCTTKTGSYNDHDYVDLGLSVKWSTKNLGDGIKDYGRVCYWGGHKEELISCERNINWEYYPFVIAEELPFEDKQSVNSFPALFFTKYNTQKYYEYYTSKNDIGMINDVDAEIAKFRASCKQLHLIDDIGRLTTLFSLDGYERAKLDHRNLLTKGYLFIQSIINSIFIITTFWLLCIPYHLINLIINMITM